jgi:hypothetical protein
VIKVVRRGSGLRARCVFRASAYLGLLLIAVQAQMMASEYKKRGGGYTTDKNEQDDSQKHLDQWTEEEWQTKEGSGHAKKDDGTEKRYLPKKAWENMNDQEKEKTDEKKQAESKKGKQYVSNTSAAKNARKGASKDDSEQISDEKGDQGGGNGNDKKNATDCTQHWEDTAYRKQGQKEYREFKDQEQGSETRSEKDVHSDASSNGKDQQSDTKKRGRGANQKEANKKHKTSNTEAKGTAGDKTRVPEKGQKVQWKALPGMVDGEVVEVVYEKKTVQGKTANGSKEDPRVVLKSSSSGKIAVHKPEAVYFD